MYRKRRYKPKKYKFSKVLSIFLVAVSVMSLFVFSESILAEAMGPAFDIQITKDSEKTNIDDEAVITGTIIPKDFSMDIIKKRIVFVLDVSGSMGDKGAGEKETRLDKAKKATARFLEELKDVPNIEVAIVSYSKYASINSSTNPNSISSISNNVRFYETDKELDYNAIVKIVNNFKANEGTNTAEGLRKAKYMLDYNDNGKIDKNIVFMTDGLPTYYPSIETISTARPTVKGSGQSVIPTMNRTNYENVEASKDSAVRIGNLYKGEANVYTVGYSLDKVDVDIKKTLTKPAIYIPNYSEVTIEAIHKSMLGDKGKKENLYYAETNTIEQLFEDIVQDIKAEYKTEAVEISLDISDSMNIQGDYEFFDKDDNPISKPIISYKSEIKNNKVVYKADPIKFRVRVKGSKIGKFEIKGYVKIKCPELNYDETLEFSFSLIFSDNNKEIPSFDVQMEKDKNIVSVDDELLITGTVIPNQFRQIITRKRIVLALDVSDSMEQNNSTKLEKLKCATKEFINQLRDSNNVEIAIVAYSSEAFINPIFDGGTDELATHSEPDETVTYNTAIEQFVYFDPSGDGYNKLIQIVDGLKTSKGTNIAEGLRKTKYILDLNDEEKIDKTVILMTDGVPGYYPVSNANESYEINNNTVYKLYDKINTETIRSSSAPYLGGSGEVSNIQGEYDSDYVKDYYNIEESKQKAIQMGNLFEGKANVYTIGYELGNTTVNIKKEDSITGSEITKTGYERSVIKEIHDSMIGDNTKNEIHYAEANTIEKLFSDLAVRISDEYISEELDINLNLPDSITLIGGHQFFDKEDSPMNKGIVTYKGTVDGGQIIYKADPVKFKFKVKGKEQGTFKIDGDVTMQYSDLDYIETVEFEINASFGDRLPVIQAELISEKDVNALPDEEVTIQYKINPKEFTLAEIDEVDNNLSGVDKLSFTTKLKFNLGEKFEIVDNGGLNKLENNLEGYDAETNDIIVNYRMGSDNVYRPENNEMIITLKVKVKGFGSTMAFGSPNYIVYNGIYNQKMKYSLETPVAIAIQEVNIIHGFYDDVIKDGIPEIDEEISDKVLMAGTIRRLASTFTGYRGTSATLNLDPKLKVQGNISVYTINGNSTTLIANINANDYVVDINGEFKYTIDMKGLVNNTESMLVVYDVEVPKVASTNEETLKRYNSDVQYLGNIKMVSINTKGLESSPELF